MDQNRARAGCKEKIGGCMSGCVGKREQKGVRDCRGGLIGVSVSGVSAALSGLGEPVEGEWQTFSTSKPAMAPFGLFGCLTGFAT